MIIMWVLLHGALNIVGFKYNVSIAYVNIFNDGRFNNLVWVLSKFVFVYGFIMQVLFVMYIETIGILYHDMVLQWEFQIIVLILKDPCRYYILGFCSMMNVFIIMNSFGARICPTSIQSWEGFQSPIPIMSKTSPSPLFQTRIWCGHLGYIMEGKIK